MSLKKPLTPIGTDIESIIIAVVLFLTCGLLMFACCFVVTQIYLCYKRAYLKKRRHLKQESGEFHYASVQDDPEFRQTFQMTYY
ncbi:unnamed protein product [Cercopithifilaria johnstoni]|uniref:Uncharacterized protein n=1 Tax=Cercopithifilaria johnstoni TaxID=2874296 RepID=A0A8J2Q5T7_9BILA|nr:unnamed protein product [Cercopithifilaria johnstoni]